jgi:acyl carrier protein
VTRPEFFALIDELLDLPAGTLKGPDVLEDNGWSSVSALGLMALGDEQFGVLVPPAKLAQCRTADDLASLFPDAITA